MHFPWKQILSLAALLAMPPCPALRAQDPLAAALAQYAHEPDPIRRARELARFGNDQVALASKQLKSGDEEGSLHTLEQYRDEVLATFQALTATGIDAEKKPAGFKELQISLRVTSRHLEDLIFTLPEDKKPFFRAVHADIGRVQNELFDVLFPKRPLKGSKKPLP